jgi:hypothetical protein
MRLETALILSLIAHPPVLVILLQTNALGVEAVAYVSSLMPPDFPEVLRICADPSLEGDVGWAVGEWNRALAPYDIGMRFELVRDGCTAYVQPSDRPLGETGEGDVAIGTIEIKPKNWTPGMIAGPEDMRFSKLDVIKVIVWNTDNMRLRRAAILHELGHVLFLTHLVDFRGIGPKPVMLDRLDRDNPPESVTELDAYLAWLTHSFCRGKACPLMYVRMPNAPASAAAATMVSAAVMVTLVVVDFGRVRRQA